MGGAPRCAKASEWVCVPHRCRAGLRREGAWSIVETEPKAVVASVSAATATAPPRLTGEPTGTCGARGPPRGCRRAMRALRGRCERAWPCLVKSLCASGAGLCGVLPSGA